MVNLTRRGFLATSVAAGSMRLLPGAVTRAGGGGRVVLKLVYDKSLGMMRAIERIVP